MLATYFIYTLMLFFMLVLALFYERYYTDSGRKLALYISIVLFSLVVGLRYDVGIDYMSYFKAYMYQNEELERMEWGYQALNRVYHALDFPYPILFITIAWIQIFGVYKSVKYIPNILPWVFFFYFVTLYFFFSINGVRQAIAFSLFLWSIQYAYRRQIVKFTALIVVAAGFHASAILMWPVYFFAHHELFKGRKIQFALYFTFLVIQSFLLPIIWQIIPDILSYLPNRYEKYNVASMMETNWIRKDSLGIAQLFWHLIYFIIIWLYPMLRERFGKYGFFCFYNLFFIGILLEMFLGTTYLSRMILYFSSIKMIILAFAADYIVSNYRRNNIIYFYYGIMVFFLLLFYMAIYNKAGRCAPFKFVDLW